MDFAKLDNDLKEMRRRNRALSLTVGGLILGLLICLVIILNVVGMERTIVVPPTIDKSFWVTRDRVSRDYLEQMGSFVAWLILDVTPASIDWKKDILLNYVAPDQHGAMQSRQDIEAERLRRINASTFFLPQQLVPNEDKQTVAIRGRLRTQVNGQETATETKAYLAEFQYAGGRMHLKSFKEMPQ
ncbi:type IV conjugative transfer system protein TraE [Noviherbaspirillum sedimenti]|uniref:Type IV conjugative transfer system protein TraE n=1 Tax=Noviherbaspirillum sedimenti TaxID=2320865 RepID=A0A3A3G0Y8_9BURK|nr:type IV conjugative transfer system protein TraE [Noviherbaspirillum sedimenti]RJG00569.1 type IV conjugative transfer system protein TraE [Noviherbaspirillum sedimenti]